MAYLNGEKILLNPTVVNNVFKWRKINEITLDGATDNIEIVTDAEGKTFNLNKIMVSMGLHFQDNPAPFIVYLNGEDFMRITSCANFNASTNRYMNFMAEKAGTEGAFGYCGVNSVASSVANCGGKVENLTRHGSRINGFENGITSLILRSIKGFEGGSPNISSHLEAGTDRDTGVYGFRTITDIGGERMVAAETVGVDGFEHLPIPKTIALIYNGLMYQDVPDQTSSLSYTGIGHFYNNEGEILGSRECYIDYATGKLHGWLYGNVEATYTYYSVPTQGVNISWLNHSGYVPYRYNLNVSGISEEGIKLHFGNYQIKPETPKEHIGYGKIAIVLSGYIAQSHSKTEQYVPFLLLDTVQGTLSLASAINDSNAFMYGYTIVHEIIRSPYLLYENIQGKSFDITIKFGRFFVIGGDYEVIVAIDGLHAATGILPSEKLLGLKYHHKDDEMYISIGGIDSDYNQSYSWSIDFYGVENQANGKFASGSKLTVWGQDV